MSKTGFAMFLAGATVGAAATWLCLRRYYEQITQEEIDSVKAAFAERKPVIANIAKNEKSNEKQEENQHKADIAKLKPDLVNYAAMATSNALRRMSRMFQTTPLHGLELVNLTKKTLRRLM